MNSRTPSPATTDAIAPHGGSLVSRLLGDDERQRWERELPKLPAVPLSRRGISDLEMISIGGFSPLEGFMTQADYESVLARMRLAQGLPWTIPITLPVAEAEAGRIHRGDPVALVDEARTPLAVLEVVDTYRPDKAREAQEVYRTTETAHPGVAALHEIRRVLKRDGRFIFVEHGLAPDRHVQRWQHRLNPLWNRIAGGCNLNRAMDTLIQTAGWRIIQLETRYVQGPKPAAFHYKGLAQPA